MKHKDLVVGTTWGLAIGFVAGAVTALLLAPAKGSETRRRLLYERDNAVEAARLRAERAMARLRRAAPEEPAEGEEGSTEEEAVFFGA